MKLLLVLLFSSILALDALQENRLANESLSCQDRCGDASNPDNPCQCHDQCRRLGNCCDDFTNVCASSDSCYYRCGEIYNATDPCHCDSVCSAAGNCCGDFTAQCNTSCSGRCSELIPPSNHACRCDEDCQELGTCCEDFPQECSDSSSQSCVGRCGENYDSSRPCHCTSDCRKYGNCCDDFIPECAATDSCDRRCGESYDPDQTCQCNEQCSNFNNCCDDFDSTCSVSCGGRCFETDNPINSVCRCDRSCKEFGNCCEDFDDLCREEKYLCKGNCSVVLARCSCMSDCSSNKNCCSDYEETCSGLPPWEKEDCATAEDMKCPEGFEVPPVILFSIDGFRSEYIYRHLTPNIWKIASCGVHAPYMRAVYPTKTFPNHYTLATGLYPESHGIVDNTMYDHELKEEFRLGSPESFNPAWWGGEPIWVSTSNSGKKSACYFWPGSDVNITRYPDYYYRYDGSVDNEERMYQALDWLDLPPEERPSFMTLYMDIVDGAGHDGGPVSGEVENALVEADRIIDILMNGLKFRNLENCVNIIVVADHGMTPTSCDRKTSLEDFGVNMDVVYARTGAMGRIGKSKDPTLWSQFNAEETHNQLRCTHTESHWLSFLKDRYLPKRYHYAYNDRIEPVHLRIDDEWLVEGRKNSNSYCDGGTHGYDNEFKNMHALFAAHGPGFKRSFNTTEPFEAIEVYNLMAELLEIPTPAPNNGTVGSLRHIMSNPINSPPTAIRNLDQCLKALQPNTDETCSVCQGISDVELRNQLDLNIAEVAASNEKHTFFHVSYDVSSNVCLLYQHDYVIIFDSFKKIPSVVSFRLDSQKYDLLAPWDCVRADPRYRFTSSCEDYFQTDNIVPVPLYPSELSFGNSIYDAIILSNQVPMYEPARKMWNYMTRSMAKWAEEYRGIFVTVGPIFDYNYDGLADSDATLEENGKFLKNDNSLTPIPTHFFLIAIRCQDARTDLTSCEDSADRHEVISFIIPNYEVEPCNTEGQQESDWIPKALVEHVARIRDIELLTGLGLFPDFDSDAESNIRFRLRLPQFTSPWVYDFLFNVPPTSGVATNVPPTSGVATNVPPTSGVTTTAIMETTSASSTVSLNANVLIMLVIFWVLFH